MAAKTIAINGRLMRRNNLPPALACVGLVVLMALALHPATDTPGKLLAAPICLLLGVIALVTAARNSYPLGQPCTVSASKGELQISGLPPVARDAIRGLTTQAVQQTEARLSHLTIELQDRRIWLELRSEDVEPLLEAFALRPEHRRATYPIGFGFLQRLAVTTILVAPALFWPEIDRRVDLLSVALLLMLSLVVALPFAWLAGFLRGRAEVGIDGLSVRWLRRRFIPFSALSAVDREKGWHGLTALLCLRAGSTVRLRTPAPLANADAQRAQGEQLCDHLRLAFDNFGETQSETAALFSALRRGEQNGQQWLETARAVALGAGYRAAAAGLDRLEQVLVAPESPADSRIAAAAVLLRNHDVGRARVQAAATSCASPHVREALETLLATEDEAELASALESFDRRLMP